ncbi:MAG: hypothetical protein ACXV7J_13710 [Methylomonas sp.]
MQRMNSLMNVTHGWMGVGMWFWLVIGVLLVILPIVVILKLSKNKSEFGAATKRTVNHERRTGMLVKISYE